jgi:hypothetical protein
MWADAHEISLVPDVTSPAMNEAEQRLEPVGLLCEECGVLTIDHARGWRALFTDDDPPEVATYCPHCAELAVRPIEQRRDEGLNT